MKTIQIADINSAEIQTEAARMGATAATLLGAGYSPAERRPDNAVTIYEVGSVRVAETNGGCVWEENDPEGFATLAQAAGVEA